jgi:tripartite-type tricarboxylate transporter receptor subunit TctC
MFSRTRLKLLALSLTLSICAAANSQGYPEKPIKMIVPFPAGGAGDLAARAIQKPLGDALGTNVIVVNIPGGSTKIAVSELVRAAPDGYTLMMVGNAAMMSYYYSGAYDTKVWNQMTNLGQTGKMPWGVLETRADSPFKSWADVVAFGKQNPGKLDVAGPAVGGMMNLIALETAKSSGITINYIPYQGGGPSNLAVLSGQVPLRVAQPADVFPNISAGKTRALALSFHSRIPEMPDVPTFNELGIMYDIPAFGFDIWGPAQLPPQIEAKIIEALKAAVKNPAFGAVTKRLLYQPVYTPPAEIKIQMKHFEENIGPKLEAAFPRKPQ